MNYKIKINNQLVDVTEEVYYAYYRMANREKYLEKCDQKNGLMHYQALDFDGMVGEAIMEDSRSDVLANIVTREEQGQLYQAISKLAEKDRELINAIYFYDQTEKEAAELLGVSQQAVHKRKTRILHELKNILEK